MREDDRWLKEIKDKLDGFEEPVPDGLWEGIETSMSGGKKRRSVIVLPWFRWGVVAAAVAVGAFLGVRLLYPPVSPSEGQVQVVAVAQDASSSPDATSGEGTSMNPQPSGKLLADAGLSTRTDRPEHGQNATRNMTSVPETADVYEATENPQTPNPSPDGLVESSLSEPECEVIQEPAAPEEKDEAEGSYEYDSLDKYLSETSQKEPAGNSPVAVNMSFSGAATSSSDVRSFNPMMFYRGSDPAFDSHGFSGDGSITGNNLQTRSMSPLMLTSSSDIKTAVDHERPVRMRLTVHKSLGRFLGVESGLSYSVLRSTFSTDSGNTLKEERQTLRYLGIPLNLTASAFRAKRFSVYVSGGGMAEKCVSGKVRITETVSGVRQGDEQNVDLTVKPVLWSLNAAAGIQVNLSSNLGFYAEPGVSYHFDDGSSVETIYKDRPFDFVMTFGARFSFR